MQNVLNSHLKASFDETKSMVLKPKTKAVLLSLEIEGQTAGDAVKMTNMTLEAISSSDLLATSTLH